MNDVNTKSKIVATMAQLISEKGYDKSSIGQIADIIGIKKASVYYYFKSKEDIFIALIQELYADDFFDESKLCEQGSDRAAYTNELLMAGENFINSYFENKNIRKIYAEIDVQTSRIPRLKELAQENDVKFRNFLTLRLSHGVEIGALPKNFDIKLYAQILYTVLVGIDQAILYDLPIEPKPVWRETISALFEKESC